MSVVDRFLAGRSASADPNRDVAVVLRMPNADPALHGSAAPGATTLPRGQRAVALTVVGLILAGVALGALRAGGVDEVGASGWGHGPSALYFPSALVMAELGHDAHQHPTPEASPDPAAGAAFGDCSETQRGVIQAGEAVYRRDCARCHRLGHGDHRAPDLLEVGLRRPRMWLTHWLEDAPYMATWNPYAQRLVETWGYTMPDTGLACAEIAAVLDFLEAQGAAGPLPVSTPVPLTTDELAATHKHYASLCTGCHGVGRGGGIGPDVGVERSRWLGTDALAAVIRHGLPGGMPPYGRWGLVSEPDIAQLAAYLQLPAPEAAEWSMADTRASWELVVPPEQRPAAPLHERDILNYFGVVLRESGKIVFFDGDRHEAVGTIEAGFATHILRMSASGRWVYAVGRDGWVTLVDLFAAQPSVVARVRGCHDSRSVETSKRDGFHDRYLIQGCYSPPQYVVYDGLTLEPLARIDLPLDTIDAGDPLTTLSVTAIAASSFDPLWVLNLKESGFIGLVDYSRPGFPLVARVPALRGLHDGGWDHLRRWFITAVPDADRMVAFDLRSQTVSATFATGAKPHPGRGANWEDPIYGWVNGTVHVGEGKLAVYGADPVGHPEHAWKVVRDVALPAAGGLFLKTHPNTPSVLLDAPMSSDPALARQICAYHKASGQLSRCFAVADHGRVTHFEFNRQGTEVWVSVWDEAGEIVVYDAQTLEVRRRITGLRTPTGKFNVFNTAHDIY